MERIRIGNDIAISWALFENNGATHLINAGGASVSLNCGGYTYLVPSFSVQGNVVSFIFPAEDQVKTGKYKIVLTERNESGLVSSYDVRDAFVLVPENEMLNVGYTQQKNVEITSVITHAAIANIKTISIVESEEEGGDNVVTFVLTDGSQFPMTVKNGSKGDKGDKGDQGIQGEKGDKGDTGARGPAGIDSVEAEIGTNDPTQAPSVDKDLTEGVLSLTFNNIKGAKGDQGEPAVAVDKFVTVEATSSTTSATDVLPATGSADTVYRVSNWDGTQYDDTAYTEYGWYNGAYKQLATRTPGIDDEPTANSSNLVKSGGVASQISQLGQCLGNVENEEISPNINAGAYIDNWNGGVLTTDATGSYSDPFFVKAGQSIVLIAAGISTAFGMIAKTNQEGTEYHIVVNSNGDGVQKYNYLVKEDGYFAISFYNHQSWNLSIIKSGTIENIYKTIYDLAGNPITSIIGGVLGDDGHYIDSLGAYQSDNTMAISEPFFVNKGFTINVRGGGYLTYVAMISRKLGNKYQVCVLSDGSTAKDYSYFAEEDGIYIVSYYKNAGLSINVFKDFKSNEILTSKIATEDWRNNLFAGIPKIGIIGDSLASGATYNPATGQTEDYIDNAWWRVLERDSGHNYLRLCAGGMSTRRWLNDGDYGFPVAQQQENKCQVYVIGLAVNDRALDGGNYLGQVSDIDLLDPDNNLDTFYGNYAKIIQKLTLLFVNAKFILLTDPRAYDDDSYNTAIKTISGLFSNAYLVDLQKQFGHLFLNGFYNVQKDGSNHYPAMAYQSMGKLIEYAISETMYENIEDFEYIQFD